MQSINMPQAALLAGMQQGQGQNPLMQQGFRGGGVASLRPMYRGGGTIGGGIIHGTPMGSRTGYFKPWKKAKKALKKVTKPFKKIAQKLVPKELAPAMTWAAPFMGPIAGPLMGGLGSLKMHGKLDPRIMLAATLPHMRFGMPTKMGGSGMGYGKWGGGSSLRNILTGKGVGSQEGILNTRFGDFGTQLDEKLFGSGPTFTKDMQLDKVIKQPGTKGWLMDLKGGALPEGQGSIAEIMKTLTGARGQEGGFKETLEVVGTIIGSSTSYAEALEMANQAGVGEHMPGTEEEYNELKRRRDEQTKDFWKGTEAENYRTGGRVGYAMGSAQFPPQRRTGFQWGSDQGEGLGGEEVEADMRYTGGFMPYGEEPKADDVPARLSKDEFVFTDQAVAGAGDGDVEIGAERLYNVMKNLEQGGRLSEETQGEMGQGIGTII